MPKPVRLGSINARVRPDPALATQWSLSHFGVRALWAAPSGAARLAAPSFLGAAPIFTIYLSEFLTLSIFPF
jgi:hypothetical protein